MTDEESEKYRKDSGECRKIRDCCIFRVNDLEVFL